MVGKFFICYFLFLFFLLPIENVYSEGEEEKKDNTSKQTNQGNYPSFFDSLFLNNFFFSYR